MTDEYIDIVFDGPPSHESGRFVEVENEDGASINAGTWIEPEDGDLFWRLRIKTSPTVNALGEMIHEISTSKGFTPPSLENLPEKLMLSVSELAEALEEHRSGKPLRYYKMTRDERHLDVPFPQEIFSDHEGSWYEEEVEVDCTDFVEPLLGKMEVSPSYYKRGDRWYTMTKERRRFDAMEWARKGAMDAKPEGILVEIGDSIIRNLHMMHSLILEARDAGKDVPSISEVLNEKVNYNAGRPEKHGRGY